MTEHNQELARRIRTARTFAGLTREQAGEQIGVVAETIGRYERGATAPEPHTLDALADTFGVPRWFLHDGFEPAQEEPAVVERVEALENRYSTLENRIAEIIARELAAALSVSTAGRAPGTSVPVPGHDPEPQGGSHL